MRHEMAAPLSRFAGALLTCWLLSPSLSCGRADLFKKKYEFDHQLKVVNRTVDGNEIETAVVAQGDSPLRGVFKSTLPVRTLGVLNGTFASEFHTVANRESKTSYAFTNLFKGGLVKVN